MRMQAIGDIIIMLPYLQSLKEKLPAGTRIDLLTKRPGEDIPDRLTLFNTVYAIGGDRNSKKQLLSFLLLYPCLLLNRYDVLFDLQNHRLSRWIRFLLRIKAFTVFDRTSSNYAGDRYKNTINALEIAQVEFKKLDAFREGHDELILAKFGLDKSKEYIVLNPAGAFENRNWEIKNYLDFCELWLKEVNANVKFLILGITKIKGKARAMKDRLGNQLIDLVDRTTQFEALLILRHVQLVISEDSGLLHMSYAVGTPSVGLLGSTRSDWTNPNLPHTYFFTSDHLPCGNCMLEKCKLPEILCMKQIKPAAVLEASLQLLQKDKISQGLNV